MNNHPTLKLSLTGQSLFFPKPVITGYTHLLLLKVQDVAQSQIFPNTLGYPIHVCSCQIISNICLLCSFIQNDLDLYKHLAEEEEHSTVNGFLQNLMEREVSGIMDQLALDDKHRDPTITMEARQQQVVYVRNDYSHNI